MDHVRWSDYLFRVATLRGQFETARVSIESLAEDPERLRSYMLSPQAGVLAINLPGITGEALAEELKQALPRQRQNKLILTVALFETFTKNVHRLILRREPKLLNPDTKIPLGKLVADGFDATVAEEIEKEVKARDFDSIRKRADYFRERLRAPWGPPTIVDAAEQTTKLRNRILHEEPDAAVTADDLNTALMVAMFVPGFVCEALVETYPDLFDQQDRINLSGRPWTRVFKSFKWLPSEKSDSD